MKEHLRRIELRVRDQSEQQFGVRIRQIAIHQLEEMT